MLTSAAGVIVRDKVEEETSDTALESLACSSSPGQPSPSVHTSLHSAQVHPALPQSFIPPTSPFPIPLLPILAMHNTICSNTT
jgi:hypothetical protein